MSIQSREISGKLFYIESIRPSKSSPMRFLLHVPRIKRIVHRVFLGIDPAIRKTSQLIYSAVYLKSLEQTNTSDRNAIAMIDGHCLDTVESYLVDREESRHFSIEELSSALDDQITLAQKIVDDPDTRSVNSTFCPLKEDMVRRFIFHLFSRIVYYALRYSVTSDEKIDQCYFDSSDVMHICSRGQRDKNYMHCKDSDREELHVLQVLKRKLEKDRIAREKDPRSVLDNFTQHAGYDKTVKTRKIQSFLAMISVAMAAYALYKACKQIF